MNISLNWLREYVDFDLTPIELGEKLMMLGTEVESINQLSEGLDNIVVGRIVNVRKHPQADKLVLCDVDVGNEELQIICGAPNAQESLVVAVALVGANLPTGSIIKETKLRGVTSFGMLCSEKELGFSEESSGLMELSDDLEVGMSLTKALGRDDVVLELELTPNRPDCLSVVGIAREVAAVTGGFVRLPNIQVDEGNTRLDELTSVTIEAPDLCLRYATRIIRNIKVGDSPAWLQNRLKSVGISPINNIVDVTNYVMFEMGQPLHAFDYDELIEHRIIVRRAREGEVPRTLDEQDHQLTSEMLVIADAEKPLAVAGVMGGLDSAISEKTTDVLLESAYFKTTSIRKTSKSLGMHTEASHRFERGTDPECVIPAINRAAQFIADFAGGDIAEGIIDIYPGKRDSTEIELRPSRVNFVLGTNIESSQMVSILTDLDFAVQNFAGSDNLKVAVPTFRPDVEREIDLIEEIARVYGYNNIPTTLPTGNIPIPKISNRSLLRESVKEHLLESGLMEAINYSFYNSDVFDQIQLALDDPLRQAIPIQNPLNQDFANMRTTLIPSLLENVSRNNKRQVNDVQFFEFAKVFNPSRDQRLPQELERVAGVMAGSLGSGIYGTSRKTVDFFDIKGIVEGVLDMSSVFGYGIERVRHPTFHPGRCASIHIGGKSICLFGEVHPQVGENYDLINQTYVFEFDFDRLVELAIIDKKFEPIPIYPSIQRDLAILVSKDILSDQPLQIIRGIGGDLVDSAYLFDLYVGNQIPEEKKSLAYTIEYRSHTETLTDDVIDEIQLKIIARLEEDLKAELRT